MQCNANITKRTVGLTGHGSKLINKTHDVQVEVIANVSYTYHRP